MQSGALLPRATGLVVASPSTWDAPPFTVPQQFRYWWRPAAAAPLGAALPPADGGGDGRLGPVGKADAAAATTALLALESVSAAGGAGARAGTGEKRLRMGPVFDRGGRVAEREGGERGQGGWRGRGGRREGGKWGRGLGGRGRGKPEGGGGRPGEAGRGGGAAGGGGS